MTSVVVNNETGLHARPASAFVHLAKKIYVKHPSYQRW